MNFREYLDQVYYHQTSPANAAAIMRTGFHLKDAAQQGIIWFTSDLNALQNRSAGASAGGAIIEVAVDIKKPAGWKEYDELMLDQIEQKFDGVLLPNKDGTINGFVFDPKKIKPIKIVS